MASLITHSLYISIRCDTAQVTLQRGNGERRSAPSTYFNRARIFDEKALRMVHWYLEEYPKCRSTCLEIRQDGESIVKSVAQQIENLMERWGRRLFKVLFGRRNRLAQLFYRAAIYEGLDRCEMIIASDDPNVLSLPWELMYCPEYHYLAWSLGGMSRTLLTEYPARQRRVDNDVGRQRPLKILVINPRSRYDADAPPRVVANSVFEAIRSDVELGNASLKVLRPPTFSALEKELSSEKHDPYDVVHYDGCIFGDELQFQKKRGARKDGKLDEVVMRGVTPEKLAAQLRDCDVPLFVLNVCKPGDGPNSANRVFAEVAQWLLKINAKAVVTMPYKIHKNGLREMMGRFYEEILSGKSISVAVAASRKQLSAIADSEWSSTKRVLPSQGWMIPALYQQVRHTPYNPSLVDHSFRHTTKRTSGYLLRPRTLLFFPDEGRYGFYGREKEVLRLERIFERHRKGCIEGARDQGKTALACVWARWIVQTGGRKRAFFISLEETHGFWRGIQKIAGELGTSTAGVRKLIRTRPYLVILDGWGGSCKAIKRSDSSASKEHEEICSFLREVQDGKSWILITNQSEKGRGTSASMKLTLHDFDEFEALDFVKKILREEGSYESFADKILKDTSGASCMSPGQLIKRTLQKLSSEG